MSLTESDIKHLARLASLYVSDEEADRLRRDLTQIMEFVDAAADRDLSGHEPVIRPVESGPTSRRDEADEPSEADQALSQAPDVKENQVRVPPVFGDQSSKENDR